MPPSEKQIFDLNPEVIALQCINLTLTWLYFFCLVSQLNQKNEKLNQDFSNKMHTFLFTSK